jgi:hypothetical protein
MQTRINGRMSSKRLEIGATITASTEAFFDSTGAGWLHHIRASKFHLRRKYHDAGSDTVSAASPQKKVIEAWFVQRTCDSIETVHFRPGSSKQDMQMLKGLATLLFPGIPTDSSLQSFKRKEHEAWRSPRVLSCTVHSTRGRSEIVHDLDDIGVFRCCFCGLRLLFCEHVCSQSVILCLLLLEQVKDLGMMFQMNIHVCMRVCANACMQ